ncbi:MAG: glycosyltransferase family 39 protein [Candidatus Acidoferrales bacterium]|nr:glycosyltransferase family 39 protein [Candidatus Acidoferrales bacterium]
MSETRVSEFDGTSLAAARTREAAVSGTVILAGLALAKLVVQFAGIRHYGFFRDELYYMACGEHLAWGYVDQPPLIALVAWLSRHLLGDSLFSLRLLPVLAGAAIVFLTGLLTRELGGGRFAQFLAAAAMLFAPAYLAFDSFFSMNAFEPVFWLLCAWFGVRIVLGASPRLWLAFGAVAGLGLENKHSMAVFGFAIVAGLVLSGQSQLFRSRWIWIGGLVAFALFLPNLLWESRHGWPQIEVVRNAQLYKNIPISPLRFLGEQIAFLHPLALPVWLGGLAWCFFSTSGRRFRFLGWTYLIVMAIFMILGGKSYYPLPVYPLLMAAGGVAIEQFFESSARQSLRAAFPSLLIVGGLIALPFGVPMLPVATFLRYSQMLPYSKVVKTERDAVYAPLPQLYADMFGWDTMAETVAQVYQSLPATDHADCGILGGNYGEAGAIDHYGPALGLPQALSGHNSYFYWGPRGYSGGCMIIFGERSDEFIKYFGDVRRAATVTSPHAMPNEQRVPVYVCRKPIAPLAVLWPRFKMII